MTMPRNPNLKTPITSAPVTQTPMGPKKGSSLPPYLPAPMGPKVGSNLPPYLPAQMGQKGPGNQAVLDRYNSLTAGAPAGQQGPNQAVLDRLKSLTAGAPAGGGMPKPMGMKKGGKAKSKVSSASKRADGCATQGKTKGRFI